jgi:hypothetical protein
MVGTHGLVSQLSRPVDFGGIRNNARDSILQKNEHGVAPNDAGPIWMGLRLNTFKNPRAYSTIAYDKGAYVAHMLRQMMWQRDTGDARFKR